MSLKDLQAEVAGYRDKAGQLADEFAQTRHNIVNDPALTPDGKRERLEPLHRQVTEQIADLHAREKTAVRSEKENLERRLFGLSPSSSTDPATVVSYRDAQSRARELEDAGDAQEIYQSALRSGDDILAAAVLEQALARGWSEIRQDYLDRHPSARDDLDDLAALAKYAANTLATTANYLPPTLTGLPHSAGFPLMPATASSQPQGAPDLGKVMAQRLGLS